MSLIAESPLSFYRMLEEIKELQPETILIGPEACDHEGSTLQLDTLRALCLLCPQTSILGVIEPLPLDGSPTSLLSPTDLSEKRPLPWILPRVEDLLQARLGMPCVRIR